MSKLVQLPVPVFLGRDGKWFVAECPPLNIATQGRTEREAKENVADLIRTYLSDPDTAKDFLKHPYSSSSLTYIPISLPIGALS